jgi:hypothetical protein
MLGAKEIWKAATPPKGEAYSSGSPCTGVSGPGIDLHQDSDACALKAAKQTDMLMSCVYTTQEKSVSKIHAVRKKDSQNYITA